MKNYSIDLEIKEFEIPGRESSHYLKTGPLAVRLLRLASARKPQLSFSFPSQVSSTKLAKIKIINPEFAIRRVHESNSKRERERERASGRLLRDSKSKNNLEEKRERQREGFGVWFEGVCVGFPHFVLTWNLEAGHPSKLPYHSYQYINLFGRVTLSL